MRAHQKIRSYIRKLWSWQNPRCQTLDPSSRPKTIRHQPRVWVIGNGTYEEYEGLKNIKLVHPHHKTFQIVAIPAEDYLDATRFYRWHIDAALYALNPPKVTSLLATKVPAGRRQTLRYDDGTGKRIDVPLEGLEPPDPELPPLDEKAIKVLPMCWKNPVTGNLALQIHPSAIRAVHLLTGYMMTDLKEVRVLVHRLQRPAISPRYVYPHD
ncbi:Clavaminate synthase-like protein [Diplocarpon rosae]|nr:Clavaminate synthase-like protein [Diplocarpon rosae]